MKEVDFLSSSETAFVYALCVHVFHSQMLPWDLIKLLKMSLHHYGVKEFAGSFIKEPSCEKCPDLSVAPFFCPQQLYKSRPKMNPEKLCSEMGQGNKNI